MPVRGQRSIWPSRPLKPTGIFSTTGTQKHDGCDGPYNNVRKYALKRGNNKNGTRKLRGRSMG